VLAALALFAILLGGIVPSVPLRPIAERLDVTNGVQPQSTLCRLFGLKGDFLDRQGDFNLWLHRIIQQVRDNLGWEVFADRKCPPFMRSWAQDAREHQVVRFGHRITRREAGVDGDAWHWVWNITEASIQQEMTTGLPMQLQIEREALYNDFDRVRARRSSAPPSLRRLSGWWFFSRLALVPCCGSSPSWSRSGCYEKGSKPRSNPTSGCRPRSTTVFSPHPRLICKVSQLVSQHSDGVLLKGIPSLLAQCREGLGRFRVRAMGSGRGETRDRGVDPIPLWDDPGPRHAVRKGPRHAVRKLAHGTINGCKPLGCPISTNLSASSCSALRIGCLRRRRGS
jgi:hypothetical protein